MKTLSSDIKERVYKELTGLLPGEETSSWFKSLEFITSENGKTEAIEIPLPNAYYRDWYEKHYRESLTAALSKVLGFQVKVTFKMTSDYQGSLFALPTNPPAVPDPVGSGRTRQERSSGGKTVEPAGEPSAAVQDKPAVPPTKTKASSPLPQNATLNSKYTFENFVIGPCNRLAHAWTLAVAENPGKAYNPLFIHGTVGLGKTHLLQAVCHYITEKHSHLNIFYLSAEGFVNDYITAAKGGTYESFRAKYRTADVLIIDDIHFLGRGEKQASQEEFFHTFNALHNAQKQIILSSDSPPQDIPSLEDRLISRFKWGMVAPLDPPSFEIRVAILKRTAEWLNKPIPDEVCNLIASNVDTNIRDLEGALKNVLGFAEVMNKSLDLSVAQEALKGLIGSAHHSLTIQNILDAISRYFNIKISDLQSKKRVKSISIPRQVGIYLARTLTPLSLEEIGASFGGKDHTTVMYAVEKIKQRVHRDPQFKTTLDLLTNNLKHGG